MDDHYSAIRTYLLNDNVPTEVVQSFETARNLYLYSFYAHQFLMVSELHAGISVEFALREKAIQASIPITHGWGMKRLLDLAIANQWISDKGFQRFQKREAARQHNESIWADMVSPLSNDARMDPTRFCKSLAEVLPQNKAAKVSFAPKGPLDGFMGYPLVSRGFMVSYSYFSPSRCIRS